jgi:hypothetical protein
MSEDQRDLLLLGRPTTPSAFGWRINVQPRPLRSSAFEFIAIRRVRGKHLAPMVSDGRRESAVCCLSNTLTLGVSPSSQPEYCIRPSYLAPTRLYSGGDRL